MAKFNMQQFILNLDGSTIPELDVAATTALRAIDAGAKDVMRSLTLGSLCANALLINSEANMKLKGLEKVEAFHLAQIIHNAVFDKTASGNVELTVAQCSMLQRLIENSFTVIVVAQAWEMLEMAHDTTH